MSEEISNQEKFNALRQVAGYRPALTVGIIGLSLFAAILEGIGLSFLLPIIETAQSTGPPPQEGLVAAFVTVYEFLGIPFTLEFIILGVASVMTARYTSSFLVAWLKAKLRTEYVRYLQTESFDKALGARIGYFDDQGSDDILNNIVTQARYAGHVIQRVVQIVEQGLLSAVYLGVALILAPVFTIGTGIILGGFLYGLRRLVESGYDVGDRVATANERVQRAVQAGMQGIRDVKLFGLSDELFSDFDEAVDQFANSSIVLRRNQAALDNFYQLATALTVFGLIYGAFQFSSLSLAGLGVFLFAMFRLAPRVSTLNNTIYQLEGELPHLVRTQSFIQELKHQEELDKGDQPVPDPVERVAFEDVSFAYDSSEKVLDEISFAFDRGEFVAFVGPSGAGKSTIVSLLTRMYEPGEGEITVNRTPIKEFPVEEWRERISVVRQNPYIFNDTLRYNITIGARSVSDEELQRACEIAQVTEFLDELPDGFDTVLGDEGVKLSGGQRQRVSIARALLKDADLLVLDEATSDLDSNIEEQVHQAIESMERDYAMLVIAHRLSTVVNADRIYTMSDGRIDETGSHKELVNQGGTYASLYATQRGTEAP
jgi:subfamily B ATP-binding cassette protein MsbA